MFETSLDILNIVKAGAITVLALLTAWVIFYLAMIFKEIYRMVKEMRGIFGKVDDLVSSLKEKIEHSTSYLLLMSQGVKKLVDIIGSYTKKKEQEEKKDKE